MAGPESSMSAKVLAEFVGTFLLVFTVGCNVLSKTPVWTGVSIACVLMVSIYSLGNISGANFNPAVSVALGISKSLKGPGLDWKTVGIFCVVQLTAGICASLSYAVLFWNAFHLGPAKGFGAMSAGLCETLYTFMLCFVVLNVAAARKYSEGVGNEWYGLAIGFVIIAGAYGAGMVSGGCFNPAVAVGIDVAAVGLHAGFGWCIPYALFELLGAAFAVAAFKMVRPGDFGNNPLNGLRTDMTTPSLMSELTSEFLGTFMLVLTVGLNVLGKSPAAAFSIAASLMSMIYALGDVSGAHFNPAVTLAILASKMGDLKPHKAGLYMLAQIAGGVAASFVYAVIYKGETIALAPKPGYGWSQVAVAEIIFTFLLCYVVLAVAVAETKSKSKSMFGLAIGSCVTVGGFAIGSISGGSLNPAVSIGLASTGGMFTNALIYSAFEFLAAGAAAGIACITHPEQPDKNLLAASFIA